MPCNATCQKEKAVSTKPINMQMLKSIRRMSLKVAVMHTCEVRTEQQQH